MDRGGPEGVLIEAVVFEVEREFSIGVVMWRMWSSAAIRARYSVIFSVLRGAIHGGIDSGFALNLIYFLPLLTLTLFHNFCQHVQIIITRHLAIQKMA